MQEVLIIKLHNYIRENNPDLLFELEQQASVTRYLKEKVSAIRSFIEKVSAEQPGYIVEDACMDLLTADLKPSRYNYIKGILEEEFENEVKDFEIGGIYQTELINIVQYCKVIFDSIAFSEDNEEDRFLRYSITGAVSEYLGGNSEKENVGNELQQPTETEP